MRLVKEYKWKSVNATHAYSTKEGWMKHALYSFEQLSGNSVPRATRERLSKVTTDEDIDTMVIWLNKHDRGEE